MAGEHDLWKIQPEDLFRMQFLQDARLSADGRQFVYSLSHVDTALDEEFITLWLGSIDNGTTRRLTSGKARDSHPAWSPDGRQIAFFSNRSGTRQLYILPIDGGEARQITSLPQGLGRGPVWSPDGQWIAFSARATADPIYPTKPYRVTRKIYRLDGLGYLHTGVHDVFIVPAEGGEVRNLTRDENHNCRYTAPVWSPDSREILFTSTFFPDEYRFFPALRAVNLNGEVRDIVRDWGYAAYSAVWTPDAKRVVFVGNPAGSPFGKQNHVWVVDSQGGTPECRTIGITAAVEGALQGDMPITARDRQIMVLDDDGQNAFVYVQDGGTIEIYKVALNGEIAYAPIMSGNRACYPSGQHKGRLLVTTTHFNNPPNLAVIDTDGMNERPLTDFNGELLKNFAMPEIESLSFKSEDGSLIEGWLMKPPGLNAPYPTLLNIHGGPHHGYGSIFHFDCQMLTGAGYAVLLVNYRGSTGYGDDFSTAIDGHLGELEYADLMAGIDHVIACGLADPDRLGVCGLSYGGFMSCWIVGHTHRFKAAVAENPLTSRISWYGVSDMALSHPESMGGHLWNVPDAYWKASPTSYASKCKTPTLLIQGELDLRTPPEQSEQFYTILKANDCIVEMLRLPGSSHSGSSGGPLEIRRAQNEALLDWMNRYVLDPVGMS